jgi:hypothetical protein
VLGSDAFMRTIESFPWIEQQLAWPMVVREDMDVPAE